MSRKSDNFALVLTGGTLALLLLFHTMWSILFEDWLKHQLERIAGHTVAEMIEKFGAVGFPALAAGGVVWFLWAYIKRHYSAAEIDPAIEAQRQHTQALIESPDRVKGSPIYISLKYALAPDPGGLGAAEKLQRGKEEFQKLYTKGMRQDFESYLIAGHVAEWLREHAKRCYASSTGYHDVVRFIEERTVSLHALFSGGPNQQNDGKIFLIPATRRVFTETHKTKKAIAGGINGMTLDGLLEWYARYLIDECKLPVWGIRSPGDAEELIAWDATRFKISIVDWAACIEDKESGATYNDLRMRETDLGGAIEQMKLAG
jgi:hypothetical protein